jgi:hypothetical protein
MALRRVKKMCLDHPDIHWASTLSIIHNGNNTGSFYTSTRDTSLQSHRVKKMFAVLSTQDIQHVHRPDLYTTDLCLCCKDAPEDNEHLWNCPERLETEREAWEETVNKIYGWAKLEQDRLVRNLGEKRRQHQKQSLEFDKPRPTVLVPSAPELWTTLRFIQGVGSRAATGATRRANTSATQSLHTWAIADLYRGTSPHSLAQVWSHLFKTTISVGQNLAHRYCKELEETIRQAAWIPRCKKHVAQEKQLQITTRKKRTPPERVQEEPRQPWRTWVGAAPAPGECACGQQETSHSNNLCPVYRRTNRSGYPSTGHLSWSATTWSDGKTGQL